MHNLKTTAYWDFTQKQYSLLRSVFTQLQKKDALVMVEGLLDISTGEMLSECEAAIYDDIFEDTLKKYHASNIAFIYKEKLQKQFWLDLNRETWKRMGRGRLKKACKILRSTHVCNVCVSAEECMNAIAKTLCDRYSAKHKGALGNLSPETY